jgi:ribosomal protein S13
MLRNALLVTIRKSNKFRPCWAVARDLFGIGSTAASLLCRELGIDPDKLSGEVPQ